MCVYVLDALGRAVFTGEGETHLLCAQLVLIKSAEQRLHLHNEQVGAVLPGLGHRTNVLQQEHSHVHVCMFQSDNHRCSMSKVKRSNKKGKKYPIQIFGVIGMYFYNIYS